MSRIYHIINNNIFLIIQGNLIKFLIRMKILIGQMLMYHFIQFSNHEKRGALFDITFAWINPCILFLRINVSKQYISFIRLAYMYSVILKFLYCYRSILMSFLNHTLFTICFFKNVFSI